MRWPGWKNWLRPEAFRVRDSPEGRRTRRLVFSAPRPVDWMPTDSMMPEACRWGKRASRRKMLRPKTQTARPMRAFERSLKTGLGGSARKRGEAAEEDGGEEEAQGEDNFGAG